MSSVTTTKVDTINTTTDLTLQTGNTSAGKIVVNATGGLVLGSNATTNAITIAANGNINVSNTAFVLGASSKTANGYTWLPNGILMQWGRLVVNTISTATFSTTFPNQIVSVSVTPITSALYIGANTIYVSSINTIAANIQSASTTTTGNAYYLAIGY